MIQSCGKFCPNLQIKFKVIFLTYIVDVQKILGQKSSKKANELSVLIKQPYDEGTTLDEKVKGLLAQGFHLVIKYDISVFFGSKNIIYN